MDKFSKEKRSEIMRAIGGRDTLPEVIVCKWLYAQGWRFRCQCRGEPGHPDVAIPKIRTLIEIRGCFWHRHEGCPTATMPKTNKSFWWTQDRRGARAHLPPGRQVAHRVLGVPLEGDRLFLKALDIRRDFFTLKPVCSGETLLSSKWG